MVSTAALDHLTVVRLAWGTVLSGRDRPRVYDKRFALGFRCIDDHFTVTSTSVGGRIWISIRGTLGQTARLDSFYLSMIIISDVLYPQPSFRSSS